MRVERKQKTEFSESGEFAIRRTYVTYQREGNDCAIIKWEYSVDCGKKFELFGDGYTYGSLPYLFISKDKLKQLQELGVIDEINKLKCECGAEKCGCNHAPWCDLYEDF